MDEVQDHRPTAAFAVAGDSQFGTVGQELPAAVVVRVSDRFGAAVPRVNVRFRVTEGGGSVSEGAVETDAEGTAATTWTLGTVAGMQQRLVATVPSATDVAAAFSAMALPGAPAVMSPDSGSGQTAVSGTKLPHDIVVSVRDSYGNGVQGRVVQFLPLTGSGSVESVIAVTDASGRARTGWTLGASGPNVALALLPGLFERPVVFVAIASASHSPLTAAARQPR
jgi:hypothetical protein